MEQNRQEEQETATTIRLCFSVSHCYGKENARRLSVEQNRQK